MTVRVQLFALAKELAGNDVVEVQLPDGGSVADLREMLAASVPGLKSILPHVMFAVNMQYAGDDAPIPESAAVACIPPVSGG